jgi:hypothetical protein
MFRNGVHAFGSTCIDVSNPVQRPDVLLGYKVIVGPSGKLRDITLKQSARNSFTRVPIHHHKTSCDTSLGAKWLQQLIHRRKINLIKKQYTIEKVETASSLSSNTSHTVIRCLATLAPHWTSTATYEPEGNLVKRCLSSKFWCFILVKWQNVYN